MQRVLLVLLLAVIALSACDQAAPVPPPAPSLVGDRGPVFKVGLQTLDGKRTTLVAFEGKPMLIEVWATWCGPCRTARTRLAAHHDELVSIATLVGVSVDQGGPAVVKSFLEKNPMEGMHEYMMTNAFRALLAPYDRSNTIPKFIYVSPEGNIVDVAYGVPNPVFTIAFLKNLAQTRVSGE